MRERRKRRVVGKDREWVKGRGDDDGRMMKEGGWGVKMRGT